MLKKLAKFIRFYTAIAKDQRAPAKAKLLPWAGLLYLLLPVDILPDFLPLLGQLDDIGLIALFLYMAINAIPDSFYKDYARQAKHPDAIDVEAVDEGK